MVCIGGVGSVARVDDRAFEDGLQADFGVDVAGALAELVVRDFAALADSYAVGTGVDLAGDKVEGHQTRDQVEWHHTDHHVVLVRTSAGALAVHVVTIQGNGSASLFAGVFGDGLHDEISGVVVSDRFG